MRLRPRGWGRVRRSGRGWQRCGRGRRETRFLFGFRSKTMQRLVCAQAEIAGEMFKRAHRRAFGSLIRAFDHHDAVGFQRGHDDGDSPQLVAARDLIARGQLAILQKPAPVVEQRVEPFDVPRRQPERAFGRAFGRVFGGGRGGHAATRSRRSSHAALMAMRRRSASTTASGGTPRAIIASGWFSRTACFQAARMSSRLASWATPSRS